MTDKIRNAPKQMTYLSCTLIRVLPGFEQARTERRKAGIHDSHPATCWRLPAKTKHTSSDFILDKKSCKSKKYAPGVCRQPGALLRRHSGSPCCRRISMAASWEDRAPVPCSRGYLRAGYRDTEWKHLQAAATTSISRTKNYKIKKARKNRPSMSEITIICGCESPSDRL